MGGVACPHAPAPPGVTLPGSSERKPSGIPAAAIARSRCLGQFQLSFSLKPRWVPHSSGEVRPRACHTAAIRRSKKRNDTGTGRSQKPVPVVLPGNNVVASRISPPKPPPERQQKQRQLSGNEEPFDLLKKPGQPTARHIASGTLECDHLNGMDQACGSERGRVAASAIPTYYS